MKIVTVIGARPQFVKAAVLSRAIAEYNKHSPRSVEEVLLHTGQHFDYDMDEVFFKEMNIPWPKYNLGISSLSHGEMTGLMISRIEKILLEEKPDWVLVYGDTNSTLAGAIAAKKLSFKIAHVEAGLRSFNIKMPEEQNRLLTDRISDLLFCPTQTALTHLKTEHIIGSAYGQKAFLTGDVMYDAALFYSKREISAHSLPKSPGAGKDSYCLATLHRAENTDDPKRLKALLNCLNEISKTKKVIIPLHPRTDHIIKRLGLHFTHLVFTKPVSYFEMIDLLKNTSLVLTDSGGLQKEAYFFKKPCITLRNETEWVELQKAGVNFVTGVNPKKILNAFHKASLIPKSAFQNSLYGNGKAGQKIIRLLLKETCRPAKKAGARP